MVGNGFCVRDAVAESWGKAVSDGMKVNCDGVMDGVVAETTVLSDVTVTNTKAIAAANKDTTPAMFAALSIVVSLIQPFLTAKKSKTANTTKPIAIAVLMNVVPLTRCGLPKPY